LRKRVGEGKGEHLQGGERTAEKWKGGEDLCDFEKRERSKEKMRCKIHINKNKVLLKRDGQLGGQEEVLEKVRRTKQRKRKKSFHWRREKERKLILGEKREKKSLLPVQEMGGIEREKGT